MEERLKKLKLALVVQWGELAERLGISRSMLDKVRAGERDPGPQLERAIIAAEQAAGLAPPPPSAAPAPPERAAVVEKPAWKKGQVDELRAIRAELKALLARLDRLLNE